MRSLLIVAFPQLQQKDYNRIQSIRQKYDERYFSIIEPHFTIVFPVFNCDRQLFIDHAADICKDIKTIKFTIRTTTIVKDSFSDYTDIFLVPDEGNSDIIKLHDKLYSGILAKELRLDIPFIPHIGIGASKIAEEAKKLSGEINKENFNIGGAIDKLNVIEYAYPHVKSLTTIELRK